MKIKALRHHRRQLTSRQKSIDTNFFSLVLSLHTETRRAFFILYTFYTTKKKQFVLVKKKKIYKNSFYKLTCSRHLAVFVWGKTQKQKKQICYIKNRSHDRSQNKNHLRGNQTKNVTKRFAIRNKWRSEREKRNKCLFREYKCHVHVLYYFGGDMCYNASHVGFSSWNTL